MQFMSYIYIRERQRYPPQFIFIKTGFLSFRTNPFTFCPVLHYTMSSLLLESPDFPNKYTLMLHYKLECPVDFNSGGKKWIVGETKRVTAIYCLRSGVIWTPRCIRLLCGKQPDVQVGQQCVSLQAETCKGTSVKISSVLYSSNVFSKDIFNYREKTFLVNGYMERKLCSNTAVLMVHLYLAHWLIHCSSIVIKRLHQLVYTVYVCIDGS